MGRKLILYAAISMDGYLADKEGGVSFLDGYGDMQEYEAFLQEVDTVVMGAVTYRQIRTELFPGAWPYQGMKSYVFTSRPERAEEEITFCSGDACKMVQQWKQQEGKHLWLCGGANLIRPLVEQNLVDEYRLMIVPVLLGGGIPLFSKGFSSIALKQQRITNYSDGSISMVYSPAK